MRSIPSRDLIGMTVELGRMMRKASGRTQPGTSVIKLFALEAVSDHPHVTMSDFSRMMNVSPSTASAFADRMAADGLVCRTQDPKNRRRTFLRLTPKGRKTLAAGRKDKAALLSPIFSILTPYDRTTLARILSTILHRSR
ncbi:MAG: MarR family transcriptional regulator [Candidatus Peribacteraceae bacterium]|jgi:DNA-binding MarR family transcriptional regulator